MVDHSVGKTSGNLAFTYYFILKLIPSIVALFALYLGYRLYVLGVTGKASLIVNAESVSGQLVNAAPGLFFAIGGLLVLIVSVRKGVKIDLGSESRNKDSSRHETGTSTLNPILARENLEKLIAKKIEACHLNEQQLIELRKRQRGIKIDISSASGEEKLLVPETILTQEQFDELLSALMRSYQNTEIRLRDIKERTIDYPRA